MNFSFGQKGEAPANKMSWWREAKFVMFIHWGIYAVPLEKWETTTTYGSDWKPVIRKETNGTVITEGFIPVKGRTIQAAVEE
jgi:hypothetical protein